MDFKQFLLEGLDKKEFRPHAVIKEIGQTIHIYLEDVPCYAEFQKGYTVYRAIDGDNRVVGAAFDLMEWKGEFPVFIEAK